MTLSSGRRIAAAGLLAAALLGLALPAPAAERAEILKIARAVALKARYATFITIGPDGQPQARVVDALGPDADFTVWVGTNPLTRKVQEIAKDPRVTLHFWDPTGPSYVTLQGTAAVVKDPEVLAVHFKDAWAPFYKDKFRGADFALIRFVPRHLEVVSESNGLTNDPKTWRPVSVEFDGGTPLRKP